MSTALEPHDGTMESAAEPVAHAHLQLTLVVGSEPIAGTVVPPHGRAVPFSGWMELTELLEDARRLREPRLPAGE